RALSTELYASIGFWAKGFVNTVVWAVEDGTHVVVTNADTGVVYGDTTLNAHEHLYLRDIATQLSKPVFLHVLGAQPVPLVYESDFGYQFVDTNGRYTGTDFHGFLMRKPPPLMFFDTAPLDLVAYQDGTFVRVTDEGTGQEYLATTLDRNKVIVLRDTTWQIGAPTFLHVEASAPITASVRMFPNAADERDESTGGT